MIERWKYISEFGGDPWMLPIWDSIYKAIPENRIQKSQKKLSELALYISTKLNMMPRIIERVNKECNEIWNITKKRDKEGDYWNGHEGRALLLDDDLIYNLIIDLDSFIFELKSCLELMSQLLMEIYKLTNNRISHKQINNEFKNIILKDDMNATWYDDLEKHRTFFIHLGAPYIAIDLTNEEEYYDLIIMKENLKKFDNRKKFLLLSDLHKIVYGFLKARGALQQHIINHLGNI
jgi:hypothetical protein